jgi:hypothetical protein
MLEFLFMSLKSLLLYYEWLHYCIFYIYKEAIKCRLLKQCISLIVEVREPLCKMVLDLVLTTNYRST